MIMSYNCISSPSVCRLASILVGNREWGVAIHMNSNLMTLSVCNLSTPPNCNCNADDQGLWTDSVVCNFVGFLNRIIHFVGSQSDKRGDWTGYYHRNKRYLSDKVQSHYQRPLKIYHLLSLIAARKCSMHTYLILHNCIEVQQHNTCMQNVSSHPHFYLQLCIMQIEYTMPLGYAGGPAAFLDKKSNRKSPYEAKVSPDLIRYE